MLPRSWRSKRRPRLSAPLYRPRARELFPPSRVDRRFAPAITAALVRLDADGDRKMTFYERCVRGALRAYKLTLSPLIGRQCRFMPSCSEYAAEALIRHGPLRGGALTAHRLCRCHPFGGSGFDPVPPARKT